MKICTVSQFLKDLTQEQGQFSPRKMGIVASLVIVVVGAMTMIAIFAYHGVVNAHSTAEYAQLGVGLGALGIGGALGAMFHTKSRQEPA